MSAVDPFLRETIAEAAREYRKQHVPPRGTNPPPPMFFDEPEDFARDFDERLHVEEPAPAPLVIINPSPFVWRDPASIPTRKWLYGRRLIRKFVSATVAPAGVGKSTLGLAEDVAMATGRNLLGNRVDAPLRVWSWNGEDPLDELERRLAAVCLHYGLTPEDFGDRLFLNSGRDKEIVIAQMTRNGFTIATPVVDAVIAAILAHRIDIVRIDPFVSSHRVSENDNGAIDAVVKAWTKIADVTGCAIDLVHHVRKTGGAEVTAEDARGASALMGAVRHLRVLNVMTEDEAARAGVENRRLYFRADDGKSNLAPPSDKSEWFHLASVSLGNGGGGPDDLVGVATKWKWPDPLDAVSVHDLRAVQVEVASGRWRANVQAADWVGKAVAQALNLDASDKRDRAKIVGLIKIWKATGMLVEVEGKDEKRISRTFIEVGTPAND